MLAKANDLSKSTDLDGHKMLDQYISGWWK